MRSLTDELKKLWNPPETAYNMAATERLQKAWQHYTAYVGFTAGCDQSASVAEPTSMGLVIAGAGCLLGSRRRQQQRSNR
jgi:hypothetical protein